MEFRVGAVSSGDVATAETPGSGWFNNSALLPEGSRPVNAIIVSADRVFEGEMKGLAKQWYIADSSKMKSFLKE